MRNVVLVSECRLPCERTLFNYHVEGYAMKTGKILCLKLPVVASVQLTKKVRKRLRPQYALKNTQPTLRYSQYLTHEHGHITLVVAAKESCFVLVRTRQHGVASRVSLTLFLFKKDCWFGLTEKDIEIQKKFMVKV